MILLVRLVIEPVENARSLQIVLENYAIPGLMIIGTDSHTPSVLLVFEVQTLWTSWLVCPWELKAPKAIGVEFTGKGSGEACELPEPEAR